MILLNDGNVLSIGRNTYGQLGIGTPVTPFKKNEFQEITTLKNIVYVSCGDEHSLFLDNQFRT